MMTRVTMSMTKIILNIFNVTIVERHGHPRCYHEHPREDDNDDDNESDESDTDRDMMM